MRGDDLVRELRSERPDVAAVFISGYADIGNLGNEISILEKPFSFPELGRCVEDALATRNRGSTFAAAELLSRASGDRRAR
jgi:FixJ family two-component response regulator